MNWHSDDELCSARVRCLVIHPSLKLVGSDAIGRAEVYRDPDGRMEEAIGFAQAIKLDVVRNEIILVNHPKPSTLLGG